MSMRKDPRTINRETPLALLLQHIWTYSLTTKSDAVRRQADTIAEASSRGFITTQIVPGSSLYGRLWKITETGLAWLRSNATLIATTEEGSYVETHCSH